MLSSDRATRPNNSQFQSQFRSQSQFQNLFSGHECTFKHLFLDLSHITARCKYRRHARVLTKHSCGLDVETQQTLCVILTQKTCKHSKKKKKPQVTAGSVLLVETKRPMFFHMCPPQCQSRCFDSCGHFIQQVFLKSRLQ